MLKLAITFIIACPISFLLIMCYSTIKLHQNAKLIIMSNNVQIISSYLYMLTNILMISVCIHNIKQILEFLKFTNHSLSTPFFGFPVTTHDPETHIFISVAKRRFSHIFSHSRGFSHWVE